MDRGSLKAGFDPFPTLDCEDAGFLFKPLHREFHQQGPVRQECGAGIGKQVLQDGPACCLVSFDPDEHGELVSGADMITGQHRAQRMGFAVP